MRAFLGDLAIVILNDATSAEELHIENPSAGVHQVGTPTGKVHGKTFTTRLSHALLDPNNYEYTEFDDLPKPTMGFRVRRGKDTQDIFLDATANPGSGHQDLWISCRNSATGATYERGWHCLEDSRLEAMRIELQAK